MEPPLGPTSAPTLSKFIIIIRVANDRNESFLLISHYFILILAYPRHRRRSVDDDGDDFGRFQKDDRFGIPSLSKTGILPPLSRWGP